MQGTFNVPLFQAWRATAFNYDLLPDRERIPALLDVVTLEHRQALSGPLTLALEMTKSAYELRSRLLSPQIRGKLLSLRVEGIISLLCWYADHVELYGQPANPLNTFSYAVEQAYYEQTGDA